MEIDELFCRTWLTAWKPFTPVLNWTEVDSAAEVKTQSKPYYAGVNNKEHLSKEMDRINRNGILVTGIDCL